MVQNTSLLRLQSLGFGGVLCLAAVALRASFSGEERLKGIVCFSVKWPVATSNEANRFCAGLGHCVWLPLPDFDSTSVSQEQRDLWRVCSGFWPKGKRDEKGKTA